MNPFTLLVCSVMAFVPDTSEALSMTLHRENSSSFQPAFPETTFSDSGRQLEFAVFTDLHVSAEDGGGAVSLRRCLEDVSRQDVEFVIVSGDQTDFGSDSQEELVHRMFQCLKVPVYAVPGNHDATWSESGGYAFARIWGDEKFCFEAAGWRFVGCPSGPDVRMSPALVSRESLVWLRDLPSKDKTIFINHYPINDEISNCRELLHVIDSLGTKLCIGGHWHVNKILDYKGIPGILCRSSLPGKDTRGIGYTIITISESGVVEARERHLLPDSANFVTEEPWFRHTLDRTAQTRRQVSSTDDATGPEPAGLLDETDVAHPATVWSKRESSNIACGFALNGKRAYYGTADGHVKCIDIDTGEEKWATPLSAKIFSTPAFHRDFWGKETLVVGCCDGFIYGIRASSGEIIWKVKAGKAVIASPTIYKGVAYIGASDGIFRAIDISSGSLKWQRDGIAGHVICKCYADATQVLFGSWGRTLYSLDTKTGALQWKWTHPSSSPMYSPAACSPLKSHSHVFVAIPDRMVWVFNAETGLPLKISDVAFAVPSACPADSLKADGSDEPYRVKGAREALGISPDGSTIYSKSMHSELVSIDAATCRENWRVKTELGYDIAPSALKVTAEEVIVPTDKGNLFAFSTANGSLLWKKHISCSLVNPVSIDRSGRILVSTMDGVIALLDSGADCLSGGVIPGRRRK